MHKLTRTRVKICGITRVEDGVAAACYGADAIGLVFYPPSPRMIDFEQARRVVDALPPLVHVVGLFVNAEADAVIATLKEVPLDLLQFHGDEQPSDCERFGRPYIKVIRMRDGVDLDREVERFASAEALLLDSYHPQLKGGSGTSFDWARIPQGIAKPMILAGGLRPDNVAQAIRAVRPFAVDVSGGVEASKGVKDAAKIKTFIDEVNRV